MPMNNKFNPNNVLNNIGTFTEYIPKLLGLFPVNIDALDGVHVE